MRSVDDFLLEISARPGDLTLRAVFADWLLERGDPRGEFIVLQLKDNPSPAERKRERELYLLHAWSWLPHALRELVVQGTHQFRQGVLAGCRIADASAAKIGAARLDPQWATVKALGNAPYELIDQCPSLEALTDCSSQVLDDLVLFRKPRPGLRELSGRFSARALQGVALAAGWSSLTVLGVRGSTGQSTRDRLSELSLLDDLELYELATPRQDRSFRPLALKWLLTSPLARQLSRLELGTGYVALAGFLDELEAVDTPLRELVLRDSAERSPLPDEPGAWGLSLRRGPRGWRSLALLPGSAKTVRNDEEMVRSILATARPGTFHDVQLPKKNQLRANSLPCLRKASKRFV